MQIDVQFMSLEGKFRTVRREVFADAKTAEAAVLAHAASGGFTDVNVADDADEDGGSVRWVAKTPRGRGGRNIAFGDWC